MEVNEFNESFEEWLDRFKEILQHRGYSGNLDTDSFRTDWEEGKDAYQSVEEFLSQDDDN